MGVCSVLFSVVLLFARSSFGDYNWWGSFSPYHPAPASDATVKDVSVDGCKITFGQLLARHGSRTPNPSKTEIYKKLQQDILHSNLASARHEIATWSLDNLGSEAKLSALGRLEMTALGAQFFKRYGTLYPQSKPFIRATDSGRVSESADVFGIAFAEQAGPAHTPDTSPYKIHIMSETRNAYNTLSHTGRCPAFKKQSQDADMFAAKAFLPAVKTVEQKVPGAQLSVHETHLLMDICPRLAVADPHVPKVERSPFCSLFTDVEWRRFDYHQSIKKWYIFGPGNKLGPTQGAGWVQELLARMTGDRDIVTDPATRTSFDWQITRDPARFPLMPQQSLFADFTHDSIFTAVLFALGLYDSSPPLSLAIKDTPVHPTKGFSAENASPLGARMYVELMQCREEDPWVRIVLNGQVRDLTKLAKFKQLCPSDPYGRCALPQFLKSVQDVRDGLNWKECGRENHKST